MKLRIEGIRDVIIFISFFFIGMRFFNYSIVFFLFYLFIVFYSKGEVFLSRQVFTFTVINFLIFLNLILFGGLNGLYEFSEFSGEILSICVFFILGSVSFFYSSISNIKFGILGFIFGLAAYSLYALGYTYFILKLNNAYSSVWNPFASEFENSPSHAINLAISSIVFLYFFLEKKNLYKILSLIFLLAVIFFGIYSGSRIFLVILPLSFIVYRFFKYSFFHNFYLILVFIFMYIVFLDGLNFSTGDDLNSFSRLLNQKLDSSGRFDLYKLGFQKLFENPFGGYSIDTSVYTTKWNHNIFFDIARIGGVVPFILMVFNVFYILYFIFKNKNKLDGLFLILIIMLIFVMQQDVVFTGSYMLFLLFSFLGVGLIMSKNFRSFNEN